MLNWVMFVFFKTHSVAPNSSCSFAFSIEAITPPIAKMVAAAATARHFGTNPYHRVSRRSRYATQHIRSSSWHNKRRLKDTKLSSRNTFAGRSSGHPPHRRVLAKLLWRGWTVTTRRWCEDQRQRAYSSKVAMRRRGAVARTNLGSHTDRWLTCAEADAT